MNNRVVERYITARVQGNRGRLDLTDLNLNCRMFKSAQSEDCSAVVCQHWDCTVQMLQHCPGCTVSRLALGQNTDVRTTGSTQRYSKICEIQNRTR